MEEDLVAKYLLKVLIYDTRDVVCVLYLFVFSFKKKKQMVYVYKFIVITAKEALDLADDLNTNLGLGLSPENVLKVLKVITSPCGTTSTKIDGKNYIHSCLANCPCHAGQTVTQGSTCVRYGTICMKINSLLLVTGKKKNESLLLLLLFFCE